MRRSRIVTLTTDFGTADTFAGQMNGVIRAIHPDAVIVDLTHEVPAHDIETGAYLLETGCAAFPPGTIHVAVVDPGVGTARRGLVVRTERYHFVLPDNGLITRVLARDRLQSAFALEAPHYRRADVSATFEGRDVFAPAAAWLCRGIPAENFGEPVHDLVLLPSGPSAVTTGQSVRVRVLWVDRFGNVTLDLPRALAEPALAEGASLRIEAPGGVVRALRGTYGEAPDLEPFALFDSTGYLEIALPRGRADQALGLKIGSEVEIVIGDR